MINRLVNFLKMHLKTYGLFHGIRKILITSVYKRLTDNVMADHVYEKSSYKYVEQFYKKHEAEYSVNGTVNEIGENEFVFWTCWLQGIETAPDLVKACIHSAEKTNTEYRVIIITYDNLQNYIDLPEFILEKHKKGFIQMPQFTDIIRLYLLYTYGGLWFDSTVYFTQPVPKNIIKENIFFFKSPLNDIYCPVSNWFIVASLKKNMLLYRLLCILLEYWRINNKCIDYFIFHYFLQAIINNDSECTDIFINIPYHNNQNPHYLQLQLLFSKYDNELWEKIKNISFCHKLTYKIPAGKTETVSRSFFSFLSNQ